MAVTSQHRGTQTTRKSKIFVRHKMQENREKNEEMNHSERGEWGREEERKREREREWQKKPDSVCCLPFKSVSPLARRLRMLMGIPFSPQSALKAQDNNLLLQVWLWLSHNTSFSLLTLNKKRMIPCSACYLSAALTAEVKVLIETLGHLLDLQLF